MSESRPKKRKIEFIESYWTGGEFGSDYQWNDNHGELIRCRNCKHREESVSPSWEAWCNRLHCGCDNDWYCADGERRDKDGQEFLTSEGRAAE